MSLNNSQILPGRVDRLSLVRQLLVVLKISAFSLSIVFSTLSLSAIFFGQAFAETGIASQSIQSDYAILFKVIDSLSATGWQAARVGLYIPGANTGSNKIGQNGFLNVLPEVYRAKVETTESVLGGREESEGPLGLDPGQESVLKELGCIAIAQKIFKRGNRHIKVEAFEFKSPTCANAGYSYLRRGATTVVVRGDGSSEDSDSISFWQLKYFFKISGTSQDDEESKSVVRSFSDRIGSIVSGHAAQPLVLTRLPRLDRVAGSERVVLGPLSAAHYFTVPGVELLSIEKARAAAVIDYQVHIPYPERLKLLYIDYGNESLAESAYSRYATELMQLQKPVSVLQGERPHALFKLNKRFLFVEKKPGGRLVLISGARKKNSPGFFARQI